MAGKVFVDTSGWYALLDRNDAGHAKALREIKRFLKDRTAIITTDYVVDESCTLAKARVGAHAASRLLDLLHETRSVTWEWIGAERFTRAEVLFRKQQDQGYSFTDCTSFVIMRELRIEQALTTDRHFKSAGFTSLLG